MAKDTAAPALDLEALRGLLSDVVAEQMAPIKAQLETLESRVAANEAMTPKFKPMEFAPERPANLRNLVGDMAVGEQREGTLTQIPMTANGHRMDQGTMAAIFAQFQPHFAQGQRVRVNLQAARIGWAEGRTWADIPGAQTAEGYIAKILPFGTRGWQYMARIKGITKPEGMSFDEFELLPA